jgi:hypothetical protein
MSVVAACTLITNFEKYTSGNSPGAADAPAPEPDAPGVDAGSACVGTVPPAPPMSATDTTEIRRLVFAMSHFGVTGSAGADASSGYNLDNKCSCPGPVECVVKRQDGTIYPDPVCDLPGGGGVDNAAKSTIDQIKTLAPGALPLLDGDAPLKRGDHTLLIVVTGYNGTPNDRDVNVFVVQASGVEASKQGRPNPDGGVLPDFEGGADKWRVDVNAVASVSLESNPQFTFTFQQKGYVAGGVLVVPYIDTPINVRLGDVQPIPLVRGLLTANLVKVGTDDYNLEQGVLTGRVLASSMLRALTVLKDPQAPTLQTCKSNPSSSYTILKGSLCSNLDVTASDMPVAGQPCDAISLAFAFSAPAAQIGTRVNIAEPPVPCNGAALDSCY